MPEYEQGSPQGYWSDLRPKPSHWNKAPLKPYISEDTLHTVEIQIERKIFQFQLRENSRGRLLRITEGGNGRRNCIIIPTSGLRDFRTLVLEMIEAAGNGSTKG